MALSKQAFVRIQHALESSYFRPEDFEIGIAETLERIITITITYRYQPTYSLVTSFDTGPRKEPTSIDPRKLFAARSRDPITGMMKPGEVSSEEPFGAKNFDEYIEKLRSWLANIKGELDYAPQWREMHGWRDEVERILAEHFKDPTETPAEPFTKDEAEALRQRLDQLEGALKAAVEKAEADQRTQEARIRDLHSTVEFLKQQVDRLDKPSMMRAILTRMVAWYRREENRKLLKDTAELAKLVADTINGGGS